LVIGGYIRGNHGVESIIVGFYRGSDLLYVARVRAGFVPATRGQVFAKLQPLRYRPALCESSRGGKGTLGNRPRSGGHEEVRLG
jgi:ATP-dependent DNA ligase